MQNLNKLATFPYRGKIFRLQDKRGKQNFHEDKKKVLEALTKPTQEVSQDVTKTMTENSKANLNDKNLVIRIDRGTLAS